LVKWRWGEEAATAAAAAAAAAAMEKYRQFADGGTGVNPFVPHWSHYKSALPIRAAKFLVMLPVALARVCLFSVALLWLAFSEFICMLIPLGIVRYPIYGLLTYVGCGFALLALGVLPIGDTIADYRRLRIMPPKVGGQRVFDAKSGTVVLANHQGLTDVLYLGMRLCPTFVFPTADGTPLRVSLLGALRRAGARRPAPALSSSEDNTLANHASWAKGGWRGPVVVFAEGTRTNGTCVLAWKKRTVDGLTCFDKVAGTALVTLEYSKAGAYTPHHTVGTAFRHVLWLCYQPWHTVSSVWLPSSTVGPALKDKPLPEHPAFLRSVLTKMIPGAVEVDVSSDKHLDFMAFWDTSQNKRYKKS